MVALFLVLSVGLLDCCCDWLNLCCHWLRAHVENWQCLRAVLMWSSSLSMLV